MGATHFSGMTTGTTSVNPGSIDATARGSVTFTLTGVAVGDLVVLEPPADLAVGLAYAGCKVSTDTVTIYLANLTGSPINDAATTWRYVWWDRT